MNNLTCPKCNQEFVAGAAPYRMAECPFCGHVFSSAGPGDPPDRPVQHEEPSRSGPPVGLGVIVALVGMGICTFVHLNASSLEAPDSVAIGIFGALMFGFGVAWSVYHAVRVNAAGAGFALLVAGVFIMAVCLLAGWTPALVAGGFLAVTGAVLMLNK
jgi:peptidoglycan/LPS O-acetylase OafA/YrhL